MILKSDYRPQLTSLHYFSLAFEDNVCCFSVRLHHLHSHRCMTNTSYQSDLNSHADSYNVFLTEIIYFLLNVLSSWSFLSTQLLFLYLYDIDNSHYLPSPPLQHHLACWTLIISSLMSRIYLTTILMSFHYNSNFYFCFDIVHNLGLQNIILFFWYVFPSMFYKFLVHT